MRLRYIHPLASLATLVAILSCGGDGIAPPTSSGPGIVAPGDSALLAGLNASGPVANSFVSPDRAVGGASVARNSEVSWVSMATGTDSDGTAATITNLRTTQRTIVPIVDGGFDPHSIPATVGDSLQLAVSRFDGGDETVFLIVGRPAPRIVRTRPPRGQTDAPLNTVITIVFSEPLDPVSVNTNSVSLSTGESRVAGEVHVASGPGYTVEFSPSALLQPSTTYTLTVNGVTNLAGTRLASPVSFTFTTSSSLSAGAVESVTISPDSATMTVGGRLRLTVSRTDADGRVVTTPFQAVTWTSSAPDVGSVHLWLGELVGIAPGTVVITARSTADGHTGTARFTVKPTTDPVGAIVTTLCSDFADSYYSGDCGLYAVNPDGSNGRFLTANGEDIDPTWSPDGRSIAFRSQRGCDRTTTRVCLNDLYVMRGDGSGIGTDGSGLRSLTAGRGLDVRGMSWSPDGSRIVFAASQFPSALYVSGELYVINADGSGLRRLVSGLPTSASEAPDWSPDGTRIVYNVVGRSDTSAIFVVNADGTNAVRISKASASRGDLRPHWSPDGTRIAFTRWWSRGPGEPKGALSEAFVMDADGSNVRQITYDSSWAWYPMWSPDGTMVALTSGDLDGLALFNADGTGGRSIAMPCCFLDVFSPLSWRRAPAAVPQSVLPSAQR